MYIVALVLGRFRGLRSQRLRNAVTLRVMIRVMIRVMMRVMIRVMIRVPGDMLCDPTFTVTPYVLHNLTPRVVRFR